MGISSSIINNEIMDKLEYFNKYGKSDCYNRDNELFLGDLKITDEILNEITKEWLINKNILNRIKSLL